MLTYAPFSFPYSCVSATVHPWWSIKIRQIIHFKQLCFKQPCLIQRKDVTLQPNIDIMAMKSNDDAPFVFGVRVEGETLADRRDETESLKMNFIYGVNTILISPRRMGKTSRMEGLPS